VTSAAATTTSTSLPAPSREDEGRAVEGIAAGPDGFVAVGIDAGEPRERAAVWVSSDGVEWNRIADKVIFVDARMRDVVWSPEGAVFVAVGGLESEGAVWVSPDGSAWERVAVLPFAGPGGGIEVEAVASDAGGLVAVGREWLSEGASIPAVWTSLDGSEWDRVEPGPQGMGDESAMIGFLSIGGSGFLVGGFVETPDQGYMPAIWSSGNAIDWTLAVIDESFEGPSVLNGLVNRLLRSSRPFAVPPSLAP
jgi:hypothetical protein